MSNQPSKEFLKQKNLIEKWITKEFIKNKDFHIRELKSFFDFPDKSEFSSHEIESLKKFTFDLCSKHSSHPLIQYLLALCYLRPWGVEKDLEKVDYWATKSSAAENSWGLNFLGVDYLDSQDYAKALEVFQKAAAKGNGEAMTSLGYMYSNGYGVPKDPKKAVQYWEMGVEARSENSMLNLGNALVIGREVPMDIDRGLYLLIRSNDIFPNENLNFTLNQDRKVFEQQFEAAQLKYDLWKSYVQSERELRPKRLVLLLIARFKEPNSVFRPSFLPLDIFKEILYFSEVLNFI